MDVTVREQPEQSRFVAQANGETVGFATYHRRGTAVAITHTEVEPRFGGQGVASTLIGAALDQLRAEGAQVLPICPFVKVFITRHPDYADLVPADRREEFGLDQPPAADDHPRS